MLNRLLRPLNERGSQRFLRESREKVWANAITLSQARRQGPDTPPSSLNWRSSAQPRSPR